MKQLKLILLPFLFTLSLNATAQLNIDSLWGIWEDPFQPDTAKLKAIQTIAWKGYLFTQPDSAFYFSQLQYNLAKQKGLKKYMSAAENTKGVSFHIRGEYAKAIEYHLKSKKIDEETGDKKSIASSLNNIGLIYKEQGNYAKAIDYFIKSLKIEEEIGNKKGIGSSLNNIGILYRGQGDYAKAIDYYRQSLKIDQELGDKQGVAGSLNNIANIYKKHGDPLITSSKEESLRKGGSKAIDYYFQSLEIFKEIGYKQGVAMTLENIGGFYLEKGTASMSHLNEDTLKVMRAKAMEYYRESLEMWEELGDKQGVAGCLNNIVSIYNYQENHSKVLDYSLRSLSLAKEVGAVEEIKIASENLWQIYKFIGNYKEALEMHELFISTRDTLESKNNKNEVIRQRYKYEYEKQAAADSVDYAKEKEITAIQLENQNLELKAKRKQQFILTSGLLIIALFAFFMYNRFKITRKQKVIIEETNQELNQTNKEIAAQRDKIEKQKEVVEKAHYELEEKNQEILDSITYAKRLQDAILPPIKLVNSYLVESFILYLPKDIVAGDFYFMDVVEENGKKLVYYVAADCTGHGVPGAMVSIVGANGLKRCIQEFNLRTPGEILDKLAQLVAEKFSQSEEKIRDGMDLALCCLEMENDKATKVHYAGANNPLWVINPNRKVIPSTATRFKEGGGFEIKANKQAICYTENISPFSTHTFEVEVGDTLYTFSDGYPDQFGGENGKKYKSANFRRFLLNIQDKNMDEQKELVNEEFENWKGVTN